MVSGVYRPIWVTVRTPRGPVQALTLVINRHHRLYTGRLALDRAAHHIAFAEGSNGPCREYLAHTVKHLHDLKIPDREMRRLWQRAPELTEEQRAEVSHALHRVVQRLLHRPTVRMREPAASPDGGAYLAVLRELFDLQAEPADLDRAVAVRPASPDDEGVA